MLFARAFHQKFQGVPHPRLVGTLLPPPCGTRDFIPPVVLGTSRLTDFYAAIELPINREFSSPENMYRVYLKKLADIALF